MRLSFLGDSIVEGVGDPSGLGWVGRLSLPEGYSRYNLGIRGQTIGEISKRAMPECQARIVPFADAAIILGGGLNDLCNIDGKRRISPDELIKEIDTLIHDLSALAPLLVIGPFCLDESFNPFYSDAIGKNMEFRNVFIEETDLEYARICHAHNISYLPMHQTLKNDIIYQQSLKDCDGIHPDEKGYARIAEIIGKWPAWQDLIATDITH